MIVLPRTDPYLLTVLNHSTGARYSYVGTKKQCEEEGVRKTKEWKSDKTEIQLTKRK